MPQNLTQLTIFVSGTEDLQAEKTALETVAIELNKVLSFDSIILKSISWPKDFRPGVNLDAQSEINRQLEGNYDMYVGILSTRFGTPTSRAGSGTEEEFRNAVSQFKKDSTSIRVLFYFKTGEQDIFNIDMVELTKVKDFRKHISKEGVHYMDFETTDSFVVMVKDHIHKLIKNEWKNDRWVEIELEAKNSKKSNVKNRENDFETVKINDRAEETFKIIEDESTEEFGYFDSLEDFEVATQSLIDHSEKMTKYTSDIGKKFTLHTNSINQLMKKYEGKLEIQGSRNNQKYISESKGIVNATAKDLDEYTYLMLPEVSVFKDDLTKVLISFKEIYVDSKDDETILTNVEQKEKDIQSFKTFIKTLDHTLEQIQSFQGSIKRMPALTKKLNKAKRKATTILGKLIADIRLSIDEANKIMQNLD